MKPTKTRERASARDERIVREARTPMGSSIRYYPTWSDSSCSIYGQGHGTLAAAKRVNAAASRILNRLQRKRGEK